MSLTNKVPEKDVHDLFTRVALHYDQMNNLISLGTQKGWRKKFLKELKVAPGEFALDLCCGTGDITIALAKQVGPSGNVIGLDFNQEMLDLAEQKIFDYIYQYGIPKSINDGYYSLFYLSQIISELIYKVRVIKKS